MFSLIEISLATLAVLLGVVYLIWAWGIKPALIRADARRYVYACYVDGVTAIVAETDYTFARFIKEDKIGKRWLVRPVATFYHLAGSEQAKQYCTGTLAQYNTMVAKYNIRITQLTEEVSKFFVPFVSKNELPFDKQLEMFSMSWESAHLYFTGVQPDKEGSIFQKRWLSMVAWYQREKNNEWVGGKLLIAAALCLLFATAPYAYTVIDRESQYTTTTTQLLDGQTVAVTSYAFADATPLMYDESPNRNHIVKSLIREEPLEIGGELVSVVLHNENRSVNRLYGTHHARAAKALGLKKGDVVYLRWGNVKTGGHYGLERWVITEPEALALIETGRFFLIEPE